jgi:hypothetical protein
MNTISEIILAFALLVISLYLLVYFIKLYYRIYQLVKINIGQGVAIVFAVSIFVLCCGRQAQEQPAENKYSNADFKDTASGKFNKIFTIEKLEDNKMNALYLYIQYAQPYHSKKMIPVSATCSFTGISFNTKWRTTVVSLVSSRDSTQLFYSVAGTMDWSLLGVTFLHNSKYFQGMIEADKVDDKIPDSNTSLFLWAFVVMGFAGFGWYYLRRYVKNKRT